MENAHNFEVCLAVEIHGWIEIPFDDKLPLDSSDSQIKEWAKSKIMRQHSIDLTGQEVINIEAVTEIELEN